jgi:hypothetical protein
MTKKGKQEEPILQKWKRCDFGEIGESGAMKRRVRDCVAVSSEGFIAGPNGNAIGSR